MGGTFGSKGRRLRGLYRKGSPLGGKFRLERLLHSLPCSIHPLGNLRHWERAYSQNSGRANLQDACTPRGPRPRPIDVLDEAVDVSGMRVSYQLKLAEASVEK
jgi:hypothetical protein